MSVLYCKYVLFTRIEKGSTNLCESGPDVDSCPGPELLEVHVAPDVVLRPRGGLDGRVIALADPREPGVTAHTFLNTKYDPDFP